MILAKRPRSDTWPMLTTSYEVNYCIVIKVLTSGINNTLLAFISVDVIVSGARVKYIIIVKFWYILFWNSRSPFLYKHHILESECITVAQAGHPEDVLTTRGQASCWQALQSYHQLHNSVHMQETSVLWTVLIYQEVLPSYIMEGQLKAYYLHIYFMLWGYSFFFSTVGLLRYDWSYSYNKCL